ncbi:hypothetical protein ACLM47_03795 [Lactococcus lactis]|uniref:hypothetical protein n=1 Tax=Lactococcus lactis TaxID=1358 RepID=UPI00398F2337
MAELTKIYRGMQNGAEAINTNFNTLTDNLKQSSDAAVKLTGDQAVAGKKTFSDDTSFKNVTVSNTATVKTLSVSEDIKQRYATTSFEIGSGVPVTAKRVGDLVTITFRGSNSVKITSGSNPPEKIPAGYRPIEAEGLDPLVAGRHIDSYYYFNPDGSINYPGEEIPVNSYFRGVRSYFTKDAWPTA